MTEEILTIPELKNLIYPYSPVEGEESDKVQNLYDALVESLGASNVQIVSRLDKSTFAPCGMFYSGEIYE